MKPEAGLTPATIQSTINQIVGQFDNEQVVKDYNQVASGYQFMQNIKSNTKNPADDIGMIYAFAKIMDPASVVREGEYATVQKYAQSWAQSFGFDVARIFSNTKFLSTGSVENMKKTAEAKYKANKLMYDNIESEYNRRIEEAKQGKIGGSIQRYAGAFQPSEAVAPEDQTMIDEAKNVGIELEEGEEGGTLWSDFYKRVSNLIGI